MEYQKPKKSVGTIIELGKTDKKGVRVGVIQGERGTLQFNEKHLLECSYEELSVGLRVSFAARSAVYNGARYWYAVDVKPAAAREPKRPATAKKGPTQVIVLSDEQQRALYELVTALFAEQLAQENMLLIAELAERREPFLEHIGYTPTRALFEAARPYFVFGFRDGKKTCGAIAVRSRPLPEHFLPAPVRLTEAQQCALQKLVLAQYGERLETDNCLPISALGEIREACLERFGAPPDKALFRGARLFFHIGTDEAGEDCVALRDLPVPARFQDDGVGVGRASAEIPELDELYRTGQYAEFLRSPRLSGANPARLPMKYLVLAINCAKQLLTPSDTRELAPNELQQSLLAADDSRELMREWKRGSQKYAAEIMAQCASTAIFPLPQNAHAETAARLTACAKTWTTNGNYLGLVRRAMYCRNNLLPYLFTILLFSYESMGSMEDGIREYCQFILDQSGTELFQAATPDARLMLLPEILRVAQTCILQDRSFSQSLKNKVVALLLELNQPERLPLLVQTISPEPDAPERLLLRLLQSFDTFAEADYEAMLRAYANPHLLQNAIALLWLRWRRKNANAPALSDALLRAMAWVLKHESTVSVDQILSLAAPSENVRLAKTQLLIASLDRIRALVPEERSLYNLGAYAAQVLWNALPEPRRLDALREQVERWELFAEAYFREMTDLPGEMDAERFTALFTVFREDKPRAALLQERYAEWIRQRLPENCTAPELAETLDALRRQRAFGAFAELYQNEYLPRIGAPAADELFQHYLDALRQSGRYADVIRTALENTALPDVTRSAVIRGALAANFSAHGLAPQSEQVFGAIGLEQAERLLERDVKRKPGTANSSVNALIAVFLKENKVLQALYLFSIYSGRAEVGFARMYEQIRAQYGEYTKRRFDSHYHIMHLAFYTLPPDELLRFLVWAGGIQIPAFKDYRPKHTYARMFNQLLESASTPATWREALQFLSWDETRMKSNAWMLCVCEGVLNLHESYAGYRETERALRYLNDENDLAYPLYNLFAYLTPYVAVSGDILPLHWLERRLENASFRAVLFADSPWSDRYLRAKNALAKYCVRQYLATERTTYHALLTELWQQLEEEDIEALMRTGADRGCLFRRMCGSYLENRDHAKMVSLLDEKNWPELTFRESEMLRLTQMLYTDAQTLQEENPLLFGSEFDVPDFKEDCAEILCSYPSHTGLRAFLARCTDPVHRYAVLSYTIGIFYEENLYQSGALRFSELDDPRLRHAFLAYMQTCYYTQLEENMTYSFFYKVWRYLKLYLARVLQQSVRLGDAAADALIPAAFLPPDDADIRAAMERKNQAEGVLRPIYEPFVRQVNAFMNQPGWTADMRESFLYAVMTGQSSEFFALYKTRLLPLEEAACREARFILSCLDYREWNACFYQAFRAEILSGDLSGAIHAAGLFSPVVYDALSALSRTEDPEARRVFASAGAGKNYAKNVGAILNASGGAAAAWSGALAPLLVSKQFVFLLYTTFRRRVIQTAPVGKSMEHELALIEKTLKYLQDAKSDPVIEAMCVLHHGVTSPGDVRRYLDALGLCFRGRRALANLQARQGDAELQIPNSWKNEARKLQRYLESDNQSPFVPDYMVSGIADTDGSGGAEPATTFQYRLQEHFHLEKRALPAEEYAKLYEDYRAAVHSAAEYARSATRSQMSGRARDALQLCLSYRQSRERGGYDRNRLLLDAGLLSLAAEEGLDDALRLQIIAELYELSDYLKMRLGCADTLRGHLDALKQRCCPLTSWQEYYPVILELDGGRDRQLQELCVGVIDASAALFEPTVTLAERRAGLEALRITADVSRSDYALCVIRAIQREIAQIDRGARLEIEIQNEDAVTDGYVYFQLKNIGTRTVIVGAAERAGQEEETAVPCCTVRASFSNLDVPVENISRLRPGYITGGRARAASLREGMTAKLELWVEQDGVRLCRCERTLRIETGAAAAQLDPNAEYKYQVEEAVTFGRLYGRERQMQQLERAIPNGIAIVFGPSRIGKTSLLNWVRNTLAAERRDNVLTVLVGGERKGRYRDYAVSFLDETTPVPFDADDNDRSMAEYLLIGPIRLALEKDPDRLCLPKNGGLTEALRAELIEAVRDSEKSAGERLSRVNALLKAAGLELWLLLDEFQQAVERWTPKRSGQFLAACEQFSATSAVKLILCGSDELLKYMVLSNANVWRSIAGEDARISVGPLDAVPFKQMIREEKRALFDAYSYHEQALDVLRDYTGGIALYGKHICNAILLNILNHPEEYRGRTTIYTYDIAEATEALLQKQTDELDKQEQIGIRTVYDNVIKGLGETEMQLLMLMADTLESRPEAVGFDVAGEFAGRTPQKGVNLADAIKIVENRQIIRRISEDSEVYDFRTLFYYHAFLGTARDHLNPALLFRSGAEDGETADWLSDVTEQLKRHRVTPGQVQDVLDAVMKSLPEDRRAEFRGAIGERYGSGTVVHTEQYIEENAGTATHIGEQTNIQINAQTITAAVTTLLGADATPDQIAAALSGMPSLRAYLPEPDDRKRVQALSESLRKTGDAFDACFEEDGTCLDEAESERLGAQMSRTERELEEITQKAEQGVVRDTISAMVTLDSLSEVDEARWEALLGVGPETVANLKALPTELYTPLSFAVTLHSIFDQIQKKHNAPLDYCPVAIMYCKVVEAMLKARHTPIYAKKLGGETVSRDSGLVFSQLVDADGKVLPSKALTIGSFAFHIVFVDRNNDVDDRGSFYAAPKWKKILLITDAARRNDPGARLWARHATDLGLVLAVRNRSAHEAVPISKEAFDWLIETLFKNGELLRIWELSKP